MSVLPSNLQHLSNDLLVRAMDEELTGSEALHVEMHLSQCEECRGRQADLRRVSTGFESFLQSWQPREQPVFQNERLQFIAGLDTARQKEKVQNSGKTLARFGWVLAAAATLAVSISYLPLSNMFVPPSKNTSTLETTSASMQTLRQASSAFEIDGETFQYLPYSNPDLPLGGSHVVQMQVPVSSLAEAGVLVEPVANRMTLNDRAVLADVLLGLDGQPIGVHVLSVD